MSSGRTFFVIFNPAAGRGRARRLVGAYRGLLEKYLGRFEDAETAGPGDEAVLADRALEEGYTSIVAVGGDGTWGAVADRIVRSVRRDVILGLLPAGTGNDFGKSIGARADRVEDVIRGMADGCTRTIDAGLAGGRHFLNVVGFGFDIAVIDDAADFPLLQGDLLYRVCALRQLFKFKGLPITVAGNAGPGSRRIHLMLTISNGNYFGGSFHIAPGARLDDGMLDAVSIFNVAPAGRARVFSQVARGRHYGHRMVEVRQAPRFVVTFDSPVRYELDGEVFTLDGPSLEIEAVKGALSVYVPPA